LKKLKANVTMGQLIVVSQKPRQLLIRELNKIDLSPDTTPEEMIASITTNKDTITFNSEHLTIGGTAHNNALYLTIACLCKCTPFSRRQ